MLSRIVLAATLFVSTFAMAQSEDLTLPGERHRSVFAHYTCDGFENEGLQTPNVLAAHNVIFEKLSANGGLSFFLLTANFDDEGADCRYSSILQRDPATNTLGLYQSHAYAVNDDADCDNKEAVDNIMASIQFFAQPDPARLVALDIVTDEASAVCGADKSGIRAVFARVRQ